MTTALLETRLALPNKRSGKVQDVYDATLEDGTDAVLIIATDRVSAFDVVLGSGLPGKGIVLTQMARFWFEHFAEEFDNHLLSTDVHDVPGLTQDEYRQLDRRILLCRKTQALPVSGVARGHIAGADWQGYERTGCLCGVRMPDGLVNGDCLVAPLFTLSIKTVTGQAKNISLTEGAHLVGKDTMHWLEQATLTLYGRAREYALQRGYVLADAKFQFGWLCGRDEPVLIDELLTPDCAQYWPAKDWQPGREQPSVDKQSLHNYLATQVAAGRWDKCAPGPELPRAVIAETMMRYLAAYERLTESTLQL